MRTNLRYAVDVREVSVVDYAGAGFGIVESDKVVKSYTFATRKAANSFAKGVHTYNGKTVKATVVRLGRL